MTRSAAYGKTVGTVRHTLFYAKLSLVHDLMTYYNAMLRTAVYRDDCCHAVMPCFAMITFSTISDMLGQGAIQYDVHTGILSVDVLPSHVLS